MSVQKRNELLEIIVNYNKQQDEYKRKLTMPSSYKVEIIKEQVDKNIEAERLKTVDKMITFNTGLSASISSKDKEKVKLKFPNKSDDSNEKYQIRVLGELQSHRAQSFISSNNNPDLILKELVNAKANNETDYLSTMLDYILMNVPPPKDQVELTEEKRNFYKSTKELSEDFKNEFGIDVLEKAADELKEIRAGGEGFLIALQSGAEKYLTKDMMLGMTEQDRINNIEIINNAAQFWPELKNKSV